LSGRLRSRWTGNNLISAWCVSETCTLLVVLLTDACLQVYYRLIEKPIDLVTIRNKVDNGSYNSLRELESDLTQLFSNARRYDEHANLPEDRFVTQDANALQLSMSAAIQRVSQQLAHAKSHAKSRQKERIKAAAQQRPQASKALAWKTAYLHFCTAERPKLSTDLTFQQRGHELGRRWKLLTPEEKQPFEALALESKRQAKEIHAAQAQSVAQPAAAHAAIDGSKGLTGTVGQTQQSYPHNAANERKRNREQSAVRKVDTMTPRMQGAIELIRACKDGGRQLSLIFEKLPSREELPDYYQVIERPVDLQTIESRVKQG
jgi:protein polybromo-1